MKLTEKLTDNQYRIIGKILMNTTLEEELESDIDFLRKKKFIRPTIKNSESGYEINVSLIEDNTKKDLSLKMWEMYSHKVGNQYADDPDFIASLMTKFVRYYNCTEEEIIGALELYLLEKETQNYAYVLKLSNFILKTKELDGKPVYTSQLYSYIMIYRTRQNNKAESVDHTII